jgi:hypothetical protein
MDIHHNKMYSPMALRITMPISTMSLARYCHFLSIKEIATFQLNNVRISSNHTRKTAHVLYSFINLALIIVIPLKVPLGFTGEEESMRKI